MKNQYYVSILLFLCSSLCFLFLKEKLVFDEPEHLIDLSVYAQNGLSSTTLQQQGNENGVMSYYFLSLLSYFFSLKSWVFFRLSACLSWVFIFWAGWFFFRKKEPHYSYYQFIILFTFTSFYAQLGAATILTEGPSLFYFTALLITLYFYQKKPHLPVWFLSCFLLGVCMSSRFYQLALLPAVGLWFLGITWHHRGSLQWWTMLGVMALALLPLVWILWQWKGFTPPLFSERYPSYTNEVAWSWHRPTSALFLIGIHLLPWLILGGFRLRKWAMEALIFIGLALVVRHSLGYVWDLSWTSPSSSGPIDALLSYGYRLDSAVGAAADVLLMALSMRTLFELVCRIIRDFPSVTKWPQLSIRWIAVFYIFWYVVEQFFVGASVPFYERYLLLIYPAMGWLIFDYFLYQKITLKIQLYLLLNLLISTWGLWRFYF
jgi:hypothetical protein